MKTPRINFTGYGPVLDRYEVTHPTIRAPQAVLDPKNRQIIQSVARDFLENGGAPMTNTFGCRDLLHERDGAKTYLEVLIQNRKILQEIMREMGICQPIFAWLGPVGDCYEPEKAPNFQEALEFHRWQAALAREAGLDGAIFETINTGHEGAAAARALHDTRLWGLVSFVANHEGTLLNGDTFDGAIRQADQVSRKAPQGYLLNCTPIEGLYPAFQKAAMRGLGARVYGAYPNASSKPHKVLEQEGADPLPHPEHTAAYLSWLTRRFGLKLISVCCGGRSSDIGTLAHSVQHRIMTSILPPTDNPLSLRHEAVPISHSGSPREGGSEAGSYWNGNDLDFRHAAQV